MNSIESIGGVESRHAKRLVCPPDTDQPARASSNDEIGAGERNARVIVSAEETHSGNSAPPNGLGAVIFSLPSTFLFLGFFFSAFAFSFGGGR